MTFFVAGHPKGQPRARAFAMKRGGQTFVRMYDPATAEGWKSLIAGAAKEHVPFPPITGPVRLEIIFYMPRPKSHYRANGDLKPNAPRCHTGKPDLDNLEKAVMDCFTNLGMWGDDSQVATKVTEKVYEGAGLPPGARISVDELNQFAEPQPAIAEGRKLEQGVLGA